MRASRCNPGQSHENGSIESRHDSLKTALDQALRLRGSRAFDDRAGYDAFVDLIVQRLNTRAAKRLGVERPLLKALPARRTAEFEELAAARPEREACKTMVGLLVLAADGHEAQLADELEQLIELDQLPDLHALTKLLAPPTSEVPDVTVELPALAGYDALLEATSQTVGEVAL